MKNERVTRAKKAYERLDLRVCYLDDKDVVTTSNSGRLSWGDWDDWKEDRDNTYFGGV